MPKQSVLKKSSQTFEMKQYDIRELKQSTLVQQKQVKLPSQAFIKNGIEIEEYFEPLSQEQVHKLQSMYDYLERWLTKMAHSKHKWTVDNTFEDVNLL